MHDRLLFTSTGHTHTDGQTEPPAYADDVALPAAAAAVTRHGL